MACDHHYILSYNIIYLWNDHCIPHTYKAVKPATATTPKGNLKAYMKKGMCPELFPNVISVRMFVTC